MTISEPATLVTDYLLALFTGVLGHRLGLAARDAEWSGVHRDGPSAALVVGCLHGDRGRRRRRGNRPWLPARDGPIR